MFSKDGADGINRPEPLTTPEEMSKRDQMLETAVSFDASGDFLASIMPKSDDSDTPTGGDD